MDRPVESVPGKPPSAFDDLPPSSLAPRDPAESFDLHRAINERRAQLENPELLRRLRSL